MLERAEAMKVGLTFLFYGQPDPLMINIREKTDWLQ